MARIVPLGGLGEIGLNAMVFEVGGERLLVDAGLMFPGPDFPGVDILVPDFTYLLQGTTPLTALVLTHAHEDHIGAVAHLLRQRQVPVYGTRLTLGMLAQRLDEAGVQAELREMAPGERLRLGSSFEVEPFRVAHSLPDAVGLALHTPQGVLVHTGDFKLDDVPLDGRPTDVQRLGELGDAGVVCLLSDSTNAEVEGETPPERLVAETFARLLPAAPGRVLVAMFASQLHRIQHLLDLCERTGRRVVLAGRAMARNVELASRLGYLRIPEGLLADAEQGASLPPVRVCILTTGAQGEPLAALTQMLQPEAEPLRVRAGDTVLVSARTIPGNERAVHALLNALIGAGAHVVHAGVEPGIHVSGHAARAQQRRVLDLVRPRAFVPIHGELRQLAAHLELARMAGVPADQRLLVRDGDVLDFSSGQGRLVGSAPAGRIAQSRGGGGDVSSEALADRRRLAQGGVVVAAVVLAADRRSFAGAPRLSGRGLTREEERLLEGAVGDVQRLLEEVSPALRADDAWLREELVRVVRRVFRERTGRRPPVVPLVFKL
ncbi:MAG: ribonuclease J [Myxococcaceae bacterium]